MTGRVSSLNAGGGELLAIVARRDHAVFAALLAFGLLFATAHAASKQRTVVVISLDGFPAYALAGSSAAHSNPAQVGPGRRSRDCDATDQSHRNLAQSHNAWLRVSMPRIIRFSLTAC